MDRQHHFSMSDQPQRAYYKFPEPKPGSRCFSVTGPSLWNRLPAVLRRPKMTLHTFKWHLKAYLFHIWCANE